MLNRLKDVFESFQQHNVRYVVIGGIASVLTFKLLPPVCVSRMHGNGEKP